MKGLRTHRTFDSEGRFNHSIIIDDENGFKHEIAIDYKQVEDQIYRKLTYKMTSLHTGHSETFINDVAENLLYILSLSLIGSTSRVDQGPNFDKEWIIGPWDEKLPSDKKSTPKGKNTPGKGNKDEGTE